MMRRIWVALALAAAVCLTGPQARADVKPHALFSDGMVLQRGMNCPIWGTADPGEEVKLEIRVMKPTSAHASIGDAVAGQDGKWIIYLPVDPEMTGGPYKLTIKGKNTITLKDVYVGEVWVCSGQSNMEWPLRAAHNGDESIRQSANRNIRLFTVPKKPSDKPLTDVNGKWQECKPDTVGGFTAVGYFFGRDLQKALDVPVGLIHTSWGGTVAEAWTTRAALENNPDLMGMVEKDATGREMAQANYEKALKKYDEDLAKYKEAAAKAKEKGDNPPRAAQARRAEQ